MPDTARLIYNQFIERGLDRIQEALSDSDSESPFIDFKENSRQIQRGQPAVAVSDLSGDGMAVFGKAASSFANADGGVIDWGVEAKQNEPKSLKPIPEVHRFAQHLNDHSNELLDPVLPGMEHTSIKSGDGSTHGFAVSYIASGPDKHYQSVPGGRVYYLRVGSNSVAMPGSMVRALVLAKARPDLRMLIQPYSWNGSGILIRNGIKTTPRDYTGIIQLESVGLVLAQRCAVAISVIDNRFKVLIRGAGGKRIRVRDQHGKEFWKADLHYLADSVLFPGSSVDVGTIDVTFDQDDVPRGIAIRFAVFAEDFTDQGEMGVPFDP